MSVQEIKREIDREWESFGRELKFRHRKETADDLQRLAAVEYQIPESGQYPMRFTDDIQFADLE